MTKCDALKLEGGKEKISVIKHLIKKKIPIMGHIGLLPQSSDTFKLQGKKILQKKKIFEDAIALSNSGVFAIVIECVVEDLAKKITKSVLVPTIGIGASKHCDGQILVIDDLVGLNSFYPKFVKKYSNIKKNIVLHLKCHYKDLISSQQFSLSDINYNPQMLDMQLE